MSNKTTDEKNSKIPSGESEGDKVIVERVVANFMRRAQGHPKINALLKKLAK